MKGSRRKKVNKRKAAKVITIIAILLIIAVIGIIILRNKVSETYGSDDGPDYTTATVETGSISTTVYGSGTLQDEDAEEYVIPDGIEIDEVYVAVGDTATAGDALASVKPSSVLSAMYTVQESIADIDDQLEDASEETIDDEIAASMDGRIKEIYADEGDDVTSVMAEHSALMLLSADGLMAVDIETAAEEGDEFTVTTDSGYEYTGTVEKVQDGTVTITFSDKAAVNGENCTITDSDGNEVASASCYIHDSITVVGYAGTVDDIEVSLNEAVDAGDTLITLEDTSYTVNYATLIDERDELAETLQNLIEIYKTGTITAEISGTVKSVPDTDEENSDDTETASSSFSICPDEVMTIEVSIDETDILSISEGQSVTVEIDSLGDETYTGVISSIDKSGSTSSGVTSYSAVVEVEMVESMLSGMSASASITIESVENALIIPVDALNKTSSTYYVYTEYDEEADELTGMVEVSIGVSNSSYVEITEGLSEGDTIYYTESSDSDSGFSMPGGGMSGGGDFSGGDMPSGGGASGGSSGGPGGSSSSGGSSGGHGGH